MNVSGRRWLPAALGLVAMLATGCGNAASDTAKTSSSSTGNTKAMRFAACMRDNGVAKFPDPDASGTLTIDGIVNGSSLDTSSAAWKRAIGACRDLEPAGFMGRKRSATEQEYALKFAQCMRDNGVKDFPDPTPGGALIDTTRIPSAAGRGALEIPGFQAAVDKCTGIYSGRLGLRNR